MKICSYDSINPVDVLFYAISRIVPRLPSVLERGYNKLRTWSYKSREKHVCYFAIVTSHCFKVARPFTARIFRLHFIFMHTLLFCIHMTASKLQTACLICRSIEVALLLLLCNFKKSPYLKQLINNFSVFYFNSQ